MNSDSPGTHEVFENAFFYFIKALRVLACNAAKQCEEMEDCNTPWQIQRDVTSGGLGSLRVSASFLSWEEAESIVDLVAALRRLPQEAITAAFMNTTSHAGCVTSVSHPAWEPLRKDAKALLLKLEKAIERNEAYFQNQ
ncbi:hypothetical protein [Pinirhizobacter soli]|uniref:hypothetical protein n=1 Tax=Pinirhizobacter soli TaxID=2786953 RepID=UPI002029DFEF|nr:hypothetical protein [Pinirhizobacter soli]